MVDFFNTLFQALAPLWEMSITAAYVSAIIIALRLLLKKRVPRQVLCLLWLVVFARLLIPVSLESPLSIVPSALPGYEQTQRTESGPGIPGRESPAAPGRPQAPAQNPGQNQPAGGGVSPIGGGPNVSLTVPEDVTPAVPSPEAPAPSPWRAVVAGVWLAGATAMGLYALFSYLRLRRRLFDAIRAPDGAWEHPNVDSPFILGIFRPRIYLPAGLMGQPRQFILCHERAHLRRLDHIVKPVCWLALALHWFNPLVWAAFLLMSRDIEAACDEAVIRRLGSQVKADYSTTLLALATGRRLPAPSPLAFDEGDAKGRIQNVLGYRRPALWVIVMSVVMAITAALCLLTDPVAAQNPDEPDLGPTASATQPPEASLADALLDPWMKEVLDGERQFISAYSQYNQGDGRTYGIHDLRTFYYGDDQYPDAVVEAGRVAIIDLDRDGINELVIWPEGEDEYLYSQVGYAILRRQGDEVYAYNPSYRSFWGLKSDGTFTFSSSADNWGIMTASFLGGRLEFSHDNMISWCESDGGETGYFVDGRKATKVEFHAAYDFQDAKPDPAWFTYKDGQLQPYLPAGAELIQSSETAAKVWLEDGQYPWLEWNGFTWRLAFTATAGCYPTVADFDGDGQDEIVIMHYQEGFFLYHVYERNGGALTLADTFDTQALLLRFNQNNVAAYNKDTREFSVTYAHTEGNPDSEDYDRHYVTGSCTLPEDFFDYRENIRDGYLHAYANDFRWIYFNPDNSIHLELRFYPSDEAFLERDRIDDPWDWDYVGDDGFIPGEHYISQPVGAAVFTLRYDGVKWILQEPDQLDMTYADENGPVPATPEPTVEPTIEPTVEPTAMPAVCEHGFDNISVSTLDGIDNSLKIYNAHNTSMIYCCQQDGFIYVVPAPVTGRDYWYGSDCGADFDGDGRMEKAILRENAELIMVCDVEDGQMRACTVETASLINAFNQDRAYHWTEEGDTLTLELSYGGQTIRAQFTGDERELIRSYGEKNAPVASTGSAWLVTGSEGELILGVSIYLERSLESGADSTVCIGGAQWAFRYSGGEITLVPGSFRLTAGPHVDFPVS